MDAYDEELDARREQPGDSGDPVSPLPGGATGDVPEDPAPVAAAGPREASDPGAVPEAPAPAPGAVPEAPAPAPGVVREASAPAPGVVREASAPAPAGARGAPEPAPLRTGIAALSLRYQITAALALAVVTVAACVHLGMVFLHVAPMNILTKQHGKAIDDWVYPEFEQNWKLFAPNPLQQNIDVQVRAEVRTGDGGERTTGWYDLSALDGAAIDGNVLPSHTQQNELRRAWDFYVASHDGENRPGGLRGVLSESYLRRVVVLRLAREHAAGHGETVDRVQVRSRTTNVPPPRWSGEQVPGAPVYHQLPWWSLPDGERTGASA
ncbi:DUF5819 family protein [Streptomyces sp. TP-A0356]|uniref:DUF5819 family protein n=1 Tax=Streptomyces sp. TP-A0356 TaxID=1359208 RepID=UPI0006E1404F|nr:DUF5819 family protein [Streptomyces sp. TP-A0356]